MKNFFSISKMIFIKMEKWKILSEERKQKFQCDGVVGRLVGLVILVEPKNAGRLMDIVLSPYTGRFMLGRTR